MISAIGLKVDGAAVDLPIAEAGRVGAASPAEFFGRFEFFRSLTALLGFLQRSLSCRGERFLGRRLFQGHFRIVVVRALHLSHHRKVY